MKICKKCKTVCTDSEVVCSNCGAPLADNSKPITPNSIDSVNEQILAELREQTRHLRFITTYIKIMLAIAAVFAVIAVIGMIAIGTSF